MVTLLGAAPAPAIAATAPASVADAPVAPLKLALDGARLTLPDMLHIVRGNPVELSLAPRAARAMRQARGGALTALDGGQRVYGWNQGLGPLKDKPLDDDQQRELQRRILLSHAAGVGEDVLDGEALLALVLRANAMARGHMGVRPKLVERMLALVNAGVAPVLPQVGSLGTGDLQPMAAAGLVLTGEKGQARYRGRTGPARRILAEAKLPVSFPPKAGEALPIISGSGLLTARHVHAVARSTSLATQFEYAFALFLEATRAEAGSLDARTHAERRIPDEEAVAGRLRELVKDSGWMTDEGRARLHEKLPRVQDAVSVRAAPHIAGTLRQTLDEARRIIEREANASTSNPLLFPRRGGKGHEFVMGGNWDGAQIGHALDTLNAQITDLGMLSHELSGRLLSPKWSYGLPADLASPPVGLNSGMVQVQTVAAALIPEMQTRAAPSGVLSRPAKDGQEDHNTMAMASARNLHANLDRMETVLAVQLLMSAQGIDLIRPDMDGLQLGAGTARIHKTIRAVVPELAGDRHMTPDLEDMTSLVREEALLGIK
ncbi:aromatic amino acid ammonia-lyase [Streptomyces sp. NBC_01381]|uniref:HAL/PAL/TAL family ammonia-lyase n=1 Tax=Streptomyces sp. NBC_01381 TaxID=2903845 RepID=UPI002250D39F|nr:aromatic amino acid ammonia-lyase [Streptomyces sp. NBC_01381]MCX4665774.1 aromatic amino acid ammonia-lyase [Streptomyces sp. NBC_01381]